MGNEHDPMGVVTSDRHLEPDDPFPYTYKICAMCKETLPEDEMTRFRNGDYVCKDCLYDYVEDHGGEYAKEYIEKDIETIWDYYMEWWFESLPKDEQLAIVREGYRKKEQEKPVIFCPSSNPLGKDQQEFCKESDGFFEFAKEKLT